MAKCAQCGVTNPEDRQTCYGCGSWLNSITLNAETSPHALTALMVETPAPIEASSTEAQPEDVK